MIWVEVHRPSSDPDVGAILNISLKLRTPTTKENTNLVILDLLVPVQDFK